MKLINSLELKSIYDNNSVWSTLFSIEIPTLNQWKLNDETLIKFVQEHLEEVNNSKTSWVNTYIKFKKLVHFIEYFVNLSYILKSTHNPSKSQSLVVEEIISTSDQMWNMVHEQPNIISKFKKLANITKSESKKQIINDWLKNFFESHNRGSKKAQYNKHYLKLQSNIANFNTHNENISTSKSNSIFIIKQNKNRLLGVSKSIKDAALKNAKKQNFDGWIFNVNESNVASICSTAKDRSFRKEAYFKYQASKHQKEHGTVNNKVIKDLMLNKHNIAQILNKPNYAELVISNYFLNTKNKVSTYLDQIEFSLADKARDIQKEINELAKSEHIRKVKPWDQYYYFNMLEKKYQKKSIKFKQYYSFHDVMPKLFSFFERKFKLSFELISSNKNVFTYKIIDKKTKHQMFLLLSPFANKNKVGAGCYQYDISLKSKIGNFTTPSIQYIELDCDPKNMSFFDFSCIIHEFGHAFHSFFNHDEDQYSKNIAYSWDLVEMPSQFLEFLVFDYSFMKKMSKGSSISKKAFLEIIASEQYFEAYHVFRNIKKNKIIFNTYLNFQPYSQKNIHLEVQNQMEKENIIYNIAQDHYMSYDNHLSDYAPTGYIYLYSAQIAQTISRKNLRYVFEDIFNSKEKVNFKEHISKYATLKDMDITEHISKDLPISTY